ncbi:MAG TPA: hypothetical protein VFH80_00635 [Solirubrobacteraceae bacterium]|nr:hypothetical protein [Solirubrobacteraceae bacterium]
MSLELQDLADNVGRLADAVIVSAAVNALQWQESSATPDAVAEFVLDVKERITEGAIERRRTTRRHY